MVAGLIVRPPLIVLLAAEAAIVVAAADQPDLIVYGSLLVTGMMGQHLTAVVADEPSAKLVGSGNIGLPQGSPEVKV